MPVGAPNGCLWLEGRGGDKPLGKPRLVGPDQFPTIDDRAEADLWRQRFNGSQGKPSLKLGIVGFGIPKWAGLVA